jgi:hypothetical protein
MSPEDFLIEEYRALERQLENFQSYYTRLETLSIGGALAAYGFLFINIEKVPAVAWWIIPIILLVSAIRCFAYYWLINFKIAAHIMKIERELYGLRFTGYETRHTLQWPGRKANLLYNAFVWTIILVSSLGMTFWRYAIFVDPIQIY